MFPDPAREPMAALLRRYMLVPEASVSMPLQEMDDQAVGSVLMEPALRSTSNV